MLVVSTRAPSKDPGLVYSGERSPDTTAALVDVSVPPKHRAGRLELPRRRPANPESEFAAVSVRSAGDALVRQWFHAANAEGKLLIYVHGFNVRFDDAVFGLAQIRVDSGIAAAPVLFAWPSRGQIFAYVYDRESANYSRDALEQLIDLACASPDIKEVDILAHSMGSWLAMESLRQLAIRHGALSPKVKSVVFAAPDLDVDVFGRQLEALGPKRPYFIFLVSKDDIALRMSRWLAGGVQRVGAVDPAAEPYRSALEALPGVTVVDISRMRGSDGLNHSTFSSNPEVIKLLGALVEREGRADLPKALTGSVLNITESLAITIDAAVNPGASSVQDQRKEAAGSTPPSPNPPR